MGRAAAPHAPAAEAQVVRRHSMRCRLTLLLTTVAIGGCAVAASISVQRQLTPVPAADCLPRALKSAPRVAAVGAPDSTGLEYSVRISDTSVMQRHVDLFVGIDRKSTRLNSSHRT